VAAQLAASQVGLNSLKLVSASQYLDFIPSTGWVTDE
jgi:hypothetical protein